MTQILTACRLWSRVLIAVTVLALPAGAAPFAAYVMDARTGQPIYHKNADTRLHPASLTKMMTLYMTFSAIERGQVTLNSKFTISSNAASEPPSKLGLRAGQQIELRYLIRAAAIKSANDAATALGEGLAGSEQAFTQQMTQMARALGMNNTQFRNAHGLTREGHYSTARDMSVLGRHLFYDFPQYYNLFSRRSADAGIAQVSATNKRFLDSYRGADGIKTGYTRAAGFNLTASAQRGNKRLIATVFGGTSTAQRNQLVAQLLDNSFPRVPERVREVRPQPPRMIVRTAARRAQPEPQGRIAQAPLSPSPRLAAPVRKTLDLSEALLQATQGARRSSDELALASSLRPPVRRDRPATTTTQALASSRPVAAPGRMEAAAVGGLLLKSSKAPKRRSQTTILATIGGGGV